MLTYASVFFKDLQVLPAPSGANANQTFDGKPVVPLAEPAVVIGKLLRLCYPRTSDAFAIADLDGIAGAYEAAKKYLVLGGPSNIEALLVDPRFLNSEPHRIYAIAYNLGLEPIVKKAAMATLSKPAFDFRLPHPPEYAHISAVALWRLQAFYQRCATRLGRELSEPICWRDQSELLTPASQHTFNNIWWRDVDASHAPNCGPRYDEEEPTIGPAAWFSEHVDEIRDKFAESADVERITGQLAKISGATLQAISACPACAKEAPDHLEALSRSVKYAMQGALAAEITTTQFTGD
ncbi:hypothetical protein MKEN_01455600 [Mycena kentingensis (nom. inval.)]|nr:hypothetical protein MKEN_01455600 [Mycena kentingensis (nom. inval.)]